MIAVNLPRGKSIETPSSARTAVGPSPKTRSRSVAETIAESFTTSPFVLGDASPSLMPSGWQARGRDFYRELPPEVPQPR